MYKLSFTLHQHTPIIHFQHYQDGATLRATEVKPKLEEFIVEKCLLLNTNFHKHESAINKITIAKINKRSLYKIHFDCPNEVKFYLPLATKMDSDTYPNKHKNIQKYIQEHKKINVSILAPTPYFANQDKIEFISKSDQIKSINFDNLRIAVYAEKSIVGNFIIRDKEIYELLEEVIPYFFIYENFGTRQDKGFGSFTVTQINQVDLTSTSTIIPKIYQYKSLTSKSIEIAFGFIQESYQLLKIGKNFQGYEKSNLFEYFVKNCTPALRWEKRYLKQQINSNRIQGKVLFYKKYDAPVDIDNFSKRTYNNWEDGQVNEYKFIRILLGLAEQYEFLVFGDNQRSDNKMKYIVTMKHTETDKEKIIERFKSPIVFKVIDKFVFVRFDNSYKEILDKEFEFTLKLKNDSSKTSHSLGKLRSPSNFDIEDFLKHYLPLSNWQRL